MFLCVRALETENELLQDELRRVGARNNHELDQQVLRLEQTNREQHNQLVLLAEQRQQLQEQLDGSEAREFPVPMREGSITFTGQTFLFGWSLPNFFFHITATYLILRHNGVALGKANYLGGM